MLNFGQLRSDFVDYYNHNLLKLVIETAHENRKKGKYRKNMKKKENTKMYYGIEVKIKRKIPLMNEGQGNLKCYSNFVPLRNTY